MSANLSAIIMILAFLLGAFMIVAGGLGFMRSNLVLMQTRSQLAQGVVFTVAAFMFIAGIGVHFSGSSNTAFLRGQLAQTSKCELEGEGLCQADRWSIALLKLGLFWRVLAKCSALPL